MTEDINKSLLYTTLTSNSTTLFSYENVALLHKLSLNCSEIATDEIGRINASNSLVGSVPLTYNPSGLYPSKVQLTLFYLKRAIGTDKYTSADLVNVCAIASSQINKAFVLETLDKIMGEYIAFQYAPSHESEPLLRPVLGEFKVTMNKIIKLAEARYDTDAFTATTAEVESVKTIMVDNIERILERGERISSLVNKTDRINNSSNAFRRRTVAIRRKMWWTNVRLMAIVGGVATGVVYMVMGAECGYPLFNQCLRGGQ
ncbi:hypothetical protein BABINDRAFT_64351 [Babjeviella inositovora NRRL Y-12698]|uniref:V-SNARE coiled-coil homology domain-containing protein n=1 Tax=Babjeviella inositovora NRRL Y-12698 TaxID=984486 RepID=A0A1E3QM41_9ASCO|nr:uncharacterized protein BABINDRAFT_64351 [Babjeviella inositovora NRRL Y-12698]ODQ78688.1 hypothetical protein BABINDRAFT_64351 [Babjeviella inositovora NRRL Y-12698]